MEMLLLVNKDEVARIKVKVKEKRLDTTFMWVKGNDEVTEIVKGLFSTRKVIRTRAIKAGWYSKTDYRYFSCYEDIDDAFLSYFGGVPHDVVIEYENKKVYKKSKVITEILYKNGVEETVSWLEEDPKEIERYYEFVKLKFNHPTYIDIK